MNYNIVYQLLPKVLADLVGQYNAEHRVLMSHVFNELDYCLNVKYCDNDDICNQTFHINHHEYIETIILDNSYYFCSERCSSYGEWSILYDYRKSLKYNN